MDVSVEHLLLGCSPLKDSVSVFVKEVIRAVTGPDVGVEQGQVIAHT